MTWAPDYVTSAELKNYIGITDNADDALVDLWITTVSRNVDDFCGRQFGKVDAAEDRFYTPVWDRSEQAWFATIDDLQDTTGLTITDENGTAVALQSSTVDGYQLLPRNAAARGRPYEQLKLKVATGEITLNGLPGWNAVPSGVKTGMFLQAARLNKRRTSPFGISGSPQEQGEIRLLARLDVDFETSLRPLVRDWWAA